MTFSTRRIYAALFALAATATMPTLLLGCGGGDDDYDDLATLPTATPSPLSLPQVTPSPVVSPSPAVLPTPAPTPTPVVPLPPVSGETLIEGQGVLVFSDVSADANLPTGPVFAGSEGFNLGATVPPLGDSGNSVQVFFSDVRDEQLRSVTVVFADRSGVREGASLPLGAVVGSVLNKNAFVIVSARPASDPSDAPLKQWHSAGGGTITVERLTDGTAKVRIENARMVPYTGVRDIGQTGSFTLNGAGFATIQK
jgi:hypothetical protein